MKIYLSSWRYIWYCQHSWTSILWVKEIATFPTVK